MGVRGPVAQSVSVGSPARNWRRRLLSRLLDDRKRVLVALLVLGPLLAAGVLVQDFRRARASVDGSFQHDAMKVFDTLREEVFECVDAAASVADLLRTFGDVDPQRFGEFARPHMERATTLVAVLWAPRVPLETRGEFEAAAQRWWGPGFAIVEAEPRAGTRQIAGPRAEYFPVYYRESLQAIDSTPFLGQDLGATPAMLDALGRARDSGEAAMTSALATSVGRTLCVYWAVYGKDMPRASASERRDALRGYVGAVFRLNAVLAYCLRQTMPGGFHIALVDEDAPREDRTLSYAESSDSGPPESWLGSRLIENRLGAALRWSRTLEVAGRRWRLTLAPTPSYVHAKVPNNVWGDAAITLVIATLVSVYLVLLIRRNDDVERLVGLRTSELQRAHDDLVAEVADRGRAEATVRRLTHQILSVQEEERRRLSRELHDEVGQSLTALVLHLRLLEDDVEEGSRQAKSRLRAGEMLAQTALECIRLAVRDLRPPALDTLGLTASLRALCEDIGHWANVPIGFSASQTAPLPAAVGVCLYRVLQEGLTNAAKYAGATRVDVGLHGNGDWVVLSIEDNGQGFDARRVLDGGHPRGVGLIGMRERLDLVGGTMEIVSQPGSGTRLLARVPAATVGPAELEKPGAVLSSEPTRVGRPF